MFFSCCWPVGIKTLLLCVCLCVIFRRRRNLMLSTKNFLSPNRSLWTLRMRRDGWRRSRHRSGPPPPDSHRYKQLLVSSCYRPLVCMLILMLIYISVTANVSHNGLHVRIFPINVYFDGSDMTSPRARADWHCGWRVFQSIAEVPLRDGSYIKKPIQPVDTVVLE